MSETPAFEAPPGWPLDVGMQQRAEGLRIARTIVKTQAPFAGVSIHTEVGDLIKLSDYIVSGLPPFMGDSSAQEQTKDTTP